jgi:hypothetical protein
MKLIFTLTVLLFTFTCTAQINKGQFLVGGSGTYSAKNYGGFDSKFRSFEMDARDGIFLLNKLAGGIQLGYTYSKQFGTDGIANQYYRQYDHSINVGPFARYYFLSAAKKINLLADAHYFRSWSKSGNMYGDSKWKSHGYAFAAGPVLFLNPNVSLETTLNYQYRDEYYYSKGVQVKLGLQVHLSKCKTIKK